MTVEIPYDADWGVGAYVLATAFRPDTANERGPGRAIGLAWLGLDRGAADSRHCHGGTRADALPRQTASRFR